MKKLALALMVLGFMAATAFAQSATVTAPDSSTRITADTGISFCPGRRGRNGSFGGGGGL